MKTRRPFDLRLKDEVTLCCVDCNTQSLALRALRKSMAELSFAEVLFITSGTHYAPGMHVVEVPPIRSHVDYSRFLVKDLVDHIHTRHVLIVQWDGYVINPDAWTDHFLDYDYIGAPWKFLSDHYRVGNGGFSLRSKRLLKALRDPAISECHPEDNCICRTYRRHLEVRYGIRFAPEVVADRFSFESAAPLGRPFGFHALHNMGGILAAEELPEVLAMLTPEIVSSSQYLLLAKRYIESGRRVEARSVLGHRLALFPDDSDAGVLLKLAELRDPLHRIRLRLRRLAECVLGTNDL